MIGLEWLRMSDRICKRGSAWSLRIENSKGGDFIGLVLLGRVLASSRRYRKALLAEERGAKP